MLLHPSLLLLVAFAGQHAISTPFTKHAVVLHDQVSSLRSPFTEPATLLHDQVHSRSPMFYYEPASGGLQWNGMRFSSRNSSTSAGSSPTTSIAYIPGLHPPAAPQKTTIGYIGVTKLWHKVEKSSETILVRKSRESARLRGGELNEGVRAYEHWCERRLGGKRGKCGYSSRGGRQAALTRWEASGSNKCWSWEVQVVAPDQLLNSFVARVGYLK